MVVEGSGEMVVEMRLVRVFINLHTTPCTISDNVRSRMDRGVVSSSPFGLHITKGELSAR